MDERILIALIAAVMTSYQSDGNLIQVPRDTASKVNESTYFNCSTDLVHTARHIFWHHGAKYVYTGGDVYEGYKGRVEIDINNATGACNLIILSVQPGDAGIYKCWEDEGHKQHSSAQLIVLDNDPICQSNVKTDGVIGQNKCNMEPDKVSLSCSGIYHGKNHPQVGWTKVGDDKTITEGLSTVTSNGRYNFTLELKGDISLDNSSYVCQITGTAAHSPYQCTSEVINVLYSFGNIEVVQAERGVSLDCVANNTFRCSYLWYYGNDTVCPVSCDKHLRTHLSGEYQCKAKCTVRGNECTFDVMNAIVTDRAPEVSERGTFLAVVLIPILFAAVVMVVLLIVLLRRSKVAKEHLAEEIRLDLYEEKLIHFMLSEKFFRAAGSVTTPEQQTEPRFEEHSEFVFDTKMEPSSGIQTINGMTIIDEEIFVVGERCSNIEVYSYENLSYCYIRQLKVKELVAAVDLASSNRNKWLYCMDKKTTGKSKAILKVDRNGDLIKTWSTAEDRGYLSVTKESNVIMTVQARNRLVEYSPEGQIIRKIKLSQSSTESLHLWHSVKLNDDCYVVSHGLHSNSLHRVCTVDAAGNLIKSFGGKSGSTVEQLNMPFYLAVSESGCVFVADSHNNRVLMLNSNLEFQKEFVPTLNDKFFGPRRIYLDEEKGFLVVATSAVEPTVETKEYCRILAVNLNPQLQIP